MKTITGRIFWWLGLILLVLACAGTVVLTASVYNSTEQSILRYANATRSSSRGKQQSDEAQVEKFNQEVLLQSLLNDAQQSDEAKPAKVDRVVLLKSLLITHGMLGTGIKAIVILFSCLSLFLLATCLVKRNETPSWKKPGFRLSTKVSGPSAAILEERERKADQ